MREFQFCNYQTFPDTLKDVPNLHYAWHFTVGLLPCVLSVKQND